MKIIGGQYKGRNFYMPKGIRPTQGIAREALFDILGQDMDGLTWLDLFAGSGAAGLEASSPKITLPSPGLKLPTLEETAATAAVPALMTRCCWGLPFGIRFGHGRTGHWSVP